MAPGDSTRRGAHRVGVDENHLVTELAAHAFAGVVGYLLQGRAAAAAAAVGWERTGAPCTPGCRSSRTRTPESAQRLNDDYKSPMIKGNKTKRHRGGNSMLKRQAVALDRVRGARGSMWAEFPRTCPMTMGPAPRMRMRLMSVRRNLFASLLSHAAKDGGSAGAAATGPANTARGLERLALMRALPPPRCRRRDPRELPSKSRGWSPPTGARQSKAGHRGAGASPRAPKRPPTQSMLWRRPL